MGVRAVLFCCQVVVFGSYVRTYSLCWVVTDRIAWDSAKCVTYIQYELLSTHYTGKLVY